MRDHLYENIKDQSQELAKDGSMNERQQFVDYVFKFYGPGEIYAEFFENKPVTREEVSLALKIIELKAPEHGHTIGYDSFDRELVRDILLHNRGETKTEYEVGKFLA